MVFEHEIDYFLADAVPVMDNRFHDIFLVFLVDYRIIFDDCNKKFMYNRVMLWMFQQIPDQKRFLLIGNRRFFRITHLMYWFFIRFLNLSNSDLQSILKYRTKYLIIFLDRIGKNRQSRQYTLDLSIIIAWFLNNIRNQITDIIYFKLFSDVSFNTW